MNLPNALTLLRIFIVPPLVVVILTNVSENWLGKPRYIVGLGLFVIAALTDLFDGMIARRWKQVSKVGKLLDPIADKLLISAALIWPQPTTWNDWQILLYTAGRAMLWVVVISSIYSMWGYFRAFFSSSARRKQSAPTGATTSAAATAQFHKN